MDKMRTEVERKLRYWGGMCGLFGAFFASGIYNYLRPVNSSEAFLDFFQGFQLGIAMVFLIFAARNILTFRKVLKSEEAIKAYYIKEHDERMAAINEKTGGSVMYTCALLIVLAGILAGYYSPVVFACLVSCGVFLLLVRKCLRVYYLKTM